MLILLLKYKLKTFYLSFTRGQRKDKRNAYIGLTVGIIIFFLILYFSSDLINYLYGNIDSGLVDLILSKSISVIFAFTFIFIMFTGIATSLSTLFLSKDLDLLMSLPISQRTIFSFKFIESYMLNSYFTFMLIFPLLISYGLTSEMKAAYYPAMIIIILALYSIPTGIGILLGMLVIRVINPNRVREIIGILSGLLGIIFVIAFQIIPRYLGENLGSFIGSGTSDIGEVINNYFDRAIFKFLPTSWAADALHGLYRGDVKSFLLNFLFLALSAAALIFVCVILSQKLYYYGWSNASQYAIRRKKRLERKIAAKEYASKERYEKTVSFEPGRGIYYILIKDFKLLLRDFKKLIQMLSPIVVFLILFYFSIARNGSLPGADFFNFIDYRTIVFLIFPLIICVFTNLTLSVNSIGAEGLNYWILKTSPVLSKTLLRIKILFGSIISIIMGLLMIIPMYFFARPNIYYLILEIILIMVFSYGLSTISTSIGAVFPEFKPEYSKRNNITFLGSMLNLVSLAVYSVIFTGIVIGSLALAYFTKIPDFFSVLIMIALEAVIILILFYTVPKAAAFSLNNREWKY